MYPIKEDWPRGPYKYGTPTHYGNKHLGIDIICPQGVALYAPANGIIKYVKGSMDTAGGGGGHMAYFYPTGRPEVIRFLHLKVPPREGNVNEGEQFGVTGSTGTNVAHLHLDIAKSKNFSINKLDDFIDPDKFQWNTESTTLTVKVLANNQDWDYSKHIDEAAGWYKLKSNNRINIKFDIENTNYSNIPWKEGQIEQGWYERNILTRAIGYDTVLLMLDKWEGTTGAGGKMVGDSPQKTLKIYLYTPEIWGDYVGWSIRHELSHCLFYLTVGEPRDPTHELFDNGSNMNAHKIFERVEYQTLKDVLKIRRKDKMELIEDNGTVFLVGQKGKIGLADMPFLSALKSITDLKKGSTAGIPQLRVIESVSLTDAFIVKEK
jgi:hypothetical protein